MPQFDKRASVFSLRGRQECGRSLGDRLLRTGVPFREVFAAQLPVDPTANC
jgi:hypothetical protein